MKRGLILLDFSLSIAKGELFPRGLMAAETPHSRVRSSRKQGGQSRAPRPVRATHTGGSVGSSVLPSAAPGPRRRSAPAATSPAAVPRARWAAPSAAGLCWRCRSGAGAVPGARRGRSTFRRGLTVQRGLLRLVAFPGVCIFMLIGSLRCVCC